MKQSTKLTLLNVIFLIGVVILIIVVIDGILKGEKFPFGPIFFLFFGSWGYFYLRKRIKNKNEE